MAWLSSWAVTNLLSPSAFRKTEMFDRTSSQSRGLACGYSELKCNKAVLNMGFLRFFFVDLSGQRAIPWEGWTQLSYELIFFRDGLYSRMNIVSRYWSACRAGSLEREENDPGRRAANNSSCFNLPPEEFLFKVAQETFTKIPWQSRKLWQQSEGCGSTADYLSNKCLCFEISLINSNSIDWVFPSAQKIN